MAEKHIFIGLGGSGVRTLAKLKYKIYERTQPTEHMTRTEVMNSTYRFMFVDTDSRDVDEANETYRSYRQGSRKFIDETELLNLGNSNPRQIYKNALENPEAESNKVITDSCPINVANSMSNTSLADGASALRLKSRLAFIRNAQTFYDSLTTNIDGLMAVGEPSEIHYWVISSSSGGTGSGVVNDVLYYVNMAAKMKGTTDDAKVGLILYTPNLYGKLDSRNNEKFYCNAYALFNEFETLSEWSTEIDNSRDIHKLVYPLDINQNLEYRPFRFCIPIDFTTDKGSNMIDQESLYSTASDLLFFIHSGPGARGFESVLSNDYDGIGQRGKNCFLIPMGYNAIRKPVNEFKDYMVIRLNYEMLKYGILGENAGNEEKQRQTSDLLERIIHNDYIARVNGICSSYLDEEMNEGQIKDSKGKTSWRLPDKVTDDWAGGLIDDIKERVNNLQIEKNSGRKAVLKKIEAMLLEWVEENVHRHGLNYVEDILVELDFLCEKIYVAYTTGEYAAEYLNPIKFVTRKAIKLASSAIKDELGGLYRKATKMDLGNRGDVSTYFNKLVEWVTKESNVIVNDELFEILKDLSVGNNGVLDKIIKHVREMKEAANNKRKVARLAYMQLAQNFLDKHLDVKTHYIPDITRFADDNGWVNEDHAFAKLYSEIVAPSVEFVQYEGYKPNRNEDAVKSLQAILRMLSQGEKNEEVLSKEGYYKFGKTCFFGDLDKNPDKVIDDLLGHVMETMNELVNLNPTIQNSFTGKSLANFVNELTDGAKMMLRDVNSAMIFFPYNMNIDLNNVNVKAFCVAPKGIASEVFPVVDQKEIQTPDDDTVMYRITTKIGMSFDNYLFYDTIKRIYEASQDKEFYHFHVRFADPRKVEMPNEDCSEYETLVKYLLMDKMKNAYSGILADHTNEYNAENFASSPIVFEDGCVRIATLKAYKMIDGDWIELSKDCFDKVTRNEDDHLYTELCAGFKQGYSNGKYNRLIKNLIMNVNDLLDGKLEREYSNAWNTLKNELTDLYKSTKGGRTEQNTIATLIDILDNQLKTVDQFLK